MKKTLNLVALLSISMFTLPVFAEEDISRGKEIFEDTCFACHGEDGKGTMDGIPDFTAKNSPLRQKEAILIDHITNGFESGTAPFAMPELGGDEDLTEQDVKDVLMFMKDEFLK